jgi:hypothetical protein
MRPELPVLIKARARIADPASWGKGHRRIDRPEHTCCAAEAIEDSETDNMDLRVRAIEALYKAAGLSREFWTPRLSDWNDAPERTHAEVLAAFDKAISISSGERQS